MCPTAAQILQEAERAQAEHEAAAAAARAEAKRATVAAAAASSAGGAVKAQAEQEAAWAAKQEEQETSAAHRDAALATAAATIGTGAPLTEAISPTLSLAIGSARERFGEVCNEGGAATTMEAAVHEAAARAAQEAQQPAPMPAREASGQTQQVAGVVQQAAAAAAAGQERGAAPQEAPAEPQPEEPSPYAMLASGLLHTLPGDQPTIGPAQTFLLSSLFQEGADEEQQQPVGSSSQLGVDPAMLAARLMEEKLEGADDVSGEAGPSGLWHGHAWQCARLLHTARPHAGLTHASTATPEPTVYHPIRACCRRGHHDRALGAQIAAALGLRS